MVQFHGCNLWSVEGSCILYSGLLKQVLLFDKRNSACGSTKRLISQGQATRSTFTFLRVIHFIDTSRTPGVCELDDEAILEVLSRICGNQTGETLARCIDEVQVAVGAIVPS